MVMMRMLRLVKDSKRIRKIRTKLRLKKDEYFSKFVIDDKKWYYARTTKGRRINKIWWQEAKVSVFYDLIEQETESLIKYYRLEWLIDENTFNDYVFFWKVHHRPFVIQSRINDDRRPEIVCEFYEIPSQLHMRTILADFQKEIELIRSFQKNNNLTSLDVQPYRKEKMDSVKDFEEQWEFYLGYEKIKKQCKWKNMTEKMKADITSLYNSKFKVKHSIPKDAEKKIDNFKKVFFLA